MLYSSRVVAETVQGWFLSRLLFVFFLFTVTGLHAKPLDFRVTIDRPAASLNFEGKAKDGFYEVVQQEQSDNGAVSQADLVQQCSEHYKEIQRVETGSNETILLSDAWQAFIVDVINDNKTRFFTLENAGVIESISEDFRYRNGKEICFLPFKTMTDSSEYLVLNELQHNGNNRYQARYSRNIKDKNGVSLVEQVKVRFLMNKEKKEEGAVESDTYHFPEDQVVGITVKVKGKKKQLELADEQELLMAQK